MHQEKQSQTQYFFYLFSNKYDKDNYILVTLKVVQNQFLKLIRNNSNCSENMQFLQTMMLL